MENKLSVNINQIDFADSEILSYTVKNDTLTLFIERWNAEILEVKFLNYASSLSMNLYGIAEVKEASESPLLEKVLNEFYEKKPIEHPFKIFQFFNSDDMCALEIICEGVDIRRIKKMV